MSNILVFEDGNLIKDIDYEYLWDGQFSQAHKSGSIIQFLKQYIPKNSIFIIPHSDGNIKRIKNDKEKHDIEWNEIQPYIDYANLNNKIFILGVLSQTITQEKDINYLYLPLDDLFFEKGIEYFFPHNKLLPWTQRSSKLCWRGGCSGSNGNNSLRVRFVKTLFSYPECENIRLSNWWSENKNIQNEFFSERIHFTEFLQYKIFFIIDGNVIASNHMWGFASGCVPFLISNGICWFTNYIKPFIHYIPINHDLSNLIEQIEFIKNNNNIDEQIAKNALEFSRIYFSSEFQKEYLINSFKKFIK